MIVENAAGTIHSKASSGVSDEDKHRLTELYDNDELIGTIVEINYRELCPPKEGVSALRFPVFRRIRDDKNISD